MDYVKEIVIIALILSSLYAFGFDNFPIIEQNTNYLVLGVSILALILVFLSKRNESEYTTIQTNPEHPGQQTPPPQSFEDIEFKKKPDDELKRDIKIPTVEQINQDWDKINKEAKKDVFKDFEEVKK